MKVFAYSCSQMIGGRNQNLCWSNVNSHSLWFLHHVTIRFLSQSIFPLSYFCHSLLIPAFYLWHDGEVLLCCRCSCFQFKKCFWNALFQLPLPDAKYSFVVVCLMFGPVCMFSSSHAAGAGEPQGAAVGHRCAGCRPHLPQGDHGESHRLLTRQGPVSHFDTPIAFIHLMHETCKASALLAFNHHTYQVPPATIAREVVKQHHMHQCATL